MSRPGTGKHTGPAHRPRAQEAGTGEAGQPISRRGLVSGALAAAAAGLTALPSAAAAQKHGDGTGAVLTVGGAIENSNRPAFSEMRDGFFKHHELRFDRAFAFSGAMLAALPQQRIAATTKQIGRAVFTGPALADVMKAAGMAPSASALRFVALDGYGVDLDAAEASGAWILATAAEGSPFGLGDFAPAWLIRTHEGNAVPPDEEEQKWVWSVFYIAVS